jgi:hypothetical protein
MELSQPGNITNGAEIKKTDIFLLNYMINISFPRKLPGDFGTPLGLFSDFR